MKNIEVTEEDYDRICSLTSQKPQKPSFKAINIFRSNQVVTEILSEIKDQRFVSTALKFSQKMHKKVKPVGTFLFKGTNSTGNPNKLEFLSLSYFRCLIIIKMSVIKSALNSDCRVETRAHLIFHIQKRAKFINSLSSF